MTEVAHECTVFAPAPETNAVQDGWRRHDGRLAAAPAASVAGLAGLGAGAVAASRGHR